MKWLRKSHSRRLTAPATTRDDDGMAAKPPPHSFRVFGTVALVGTLTADDVAGSAVYFNARYMLEAAASAPIPATKQLGNLTRAFVEQAFDDMRWPAEYAEIVRTYNRRLDEPDVWRLYLLRVALQNARLLRKYRGAFSTTSRGRELLAPGREGALYLELFEAYFVRTNLAFTDGYPEDPWLQHGVPDLLGLLRATAAERPDHRRSRRRTGRRHPGLDGGGDLQHTARGALGRAPAPHPRATRGLRARRGSCSIGADAAPVARLRGPCGDDHLALRQVRRRRTDAELTIAQEKQKPP